MEHPGLNPAPPHEVVAPARLLATEGAITRVLRASLSEEATREVVSSIMREAVIPLALDLARDGSEARAEVERLKAAVSEAKFRPVGDNHHNALACPYCTPKKCPRCGTGLNGLNCPSCRATIASSDAR